MNLIDIRKSLNMGIPLSNLPLRVTFYGRVSTNHEEQHSSLINQQEHFKYSILSNPNWTYIEGYIDDGISGTSSLKRTNFLRMIEDSKKDLFDLIITKEISRFSRNTLDSIKYTRELLNNGVAVLFINDNINTIYPDSELRLTIMASLAQDEIRRLSERVKFGMNMSLKKGIILGNNKLYGYKKYKDKLTINKKQSIIVKQIFNMYVLDNKSIPYICNYLNTKGIKTNYNKEWCTSTILRMLRNPKYKGYYCGNKSYTVDYMSKKVKKTSTKDWIMYKSPSKIPPIIEESLWNQANTKLSRKCKINTSKEYLYTARLTCTKHSCYLHRRNQVKSTNDISWICKEHLQGNKCYLNIRESELTKIFQSIIEELNINYPRILSILNYLYKKEISLPKINITSLILSKVLITKELSTYYLSIYLNLSPSIIERINTLKFSFNRDINNKYTKTKYIEYNLKIFNN